MGDLTANFSRWELECKCGCGLMNMQPEALEKMELVREDVDRPLTASSGSRCPAHNKAEGGKPLSAHLDGYALDIKTANGRERYEIVTAGLRAGFTRIGVARSFVHLDCHPDKFPEVFWSY